MAKRYHQTRKDREDERRGMDRYERRMRHDREDEKMGMERRDRKEHRSREYHEGFGESPRKMDIPGTRDRDMYFKKLDRDPSMDYAKCKAKIDEEDERKLRRHSMHDDY